MHGGRVGNFVPRPGLPAQVVRVAWTTRAPEVEPAAVPAATALAVLEKLNRGVLLLGPDACVRFMNRAAASMLGSGSPLSVRRGRLEFACREAGHRFERYLRGAGGGGDAESLVLRVAGPGRREAYRLLVSPLEHDGGPASGYCVFIYEPAGGRQALPMKVLRELYGLTPAEARLANALFVHPTLREAAARSGITVNTARSVLKKVFGKCRVESQAELLQLLALGPRTL